VKEFCCQIVLPPSLFHDAFRKDAIVGGYCKRKIWAKKQAALVACNALKEKDMMETDGKASSSFLGEMALLKEMHPFPLQSTPLAQEAKTAVISPALNKSISDSASNYSNEDVVDASDTSDEIYYADNDRSISKWVSVNSARTVLDRYIQEMEHRQICTIEERTVKNQCRTSLNGVVGIITTVFSSVMVLPLAKQTPAFITLQGPFKPTLRRARTAIAVEACKVLIEKGLLDRQFRPVLHDTYWLENEGYEEHAHEVLNHFVKSRRKDGVVLQKERPQQMQARAEITMEISSPSFPNIRKTGYSIQPYEVKEAKNSAAFQVCKELYNQGHLPSPYVVTFSTRKNGAEKPPPSPGEDRKRHHTPTSHFHVCPRVPPQAYQSLEFKSRKLFVYAMEFHDPISGDRSTRRSMGLIFGTLLSDCCLRQFIFPGEQGLPAAVSLRYCSEYSDFGGTLDERLRQLQQFHDFIFTTVLQIIPRWMSLISIHDIGGPVVCPLRGDDIEWDTLSELERLHLPVGGSTLDGDDDHHHTDDNTAGSAHISPGASAVDKAMSLVNSMVTWEGGFYHVMSVAVPSTTANTTATTTTATPTATTTTTTIAVENETSPTKVIAADAASTTATKKISQVEYPKPSKPVKVVARAFKGSISKRSAGLFSGQRTLRPDLMQRHPVALECWHALAFLPRLLHRVESLLAAGELIAAVGVVPAIAVLPSVPSNDGDGSDGVARRDQNMPSTAMYHAQVPLPLLTSDNGCSSDYVEPFECELSTRHGGGGGDDEWTFECLLCLKAHCRTHLIPDPSQRLALTPSNVLKCLTLAECAEEFSLESEEILGDSFLQLAATLHVYHHHLEGTADVEALDLARHPYLTNGDLSKKALARHYPRYMYTTKLLEYSNWVPPRYKIPESIEQCIAEFDLSPDLRTEFPGLGSVMHTLSHHDMLALLAAPPASPERTSIVFNACRRRFGGNGKLRYCEVTKRIMRETSNTSGLAATTSSTFDHILTEDGSPLPAEKIIKYRHHITVAPKSVADSVEATIACYLLAAGAEGALSFMSWMGMPLTSGVVEDAKPHAADRKNETSRFGWPSRASCTR
jgi:hypothetical protein